MLRGAAGPPPFSPLPKHTHLATQRSEEVIVVERVLDDVDVVRSMSGCGAVMSHVSSMYRMGDAWRASGTRCNFGSNPNAVAFDSAS